MSNIYIINKGCLSVKKNDKNSNASYPSNAFYHPTHDSNFDYLIGL